MLRFPVILICLVIGVIVSLLVAMSMVGWGSDSKWALDFTIGKFVIPTRKDIRIWEKYAPEKWRKETPYAMEYLSSDRRIVQMMAVSGEYEVEGMSPASFFSDAITSKRHHYRVYRFQFGWPFYCTGAESWSEMRGMTTVSGGTNAYSPSKKLTIPTQVNALGLIGNTLFYAPMAWIFLFIYMHIRKALRYWRQRCPNCAYDLHDTMDQGCPECGWNRPVNSEAEDEPAR